jgi:hypothetical protein
VRSRALSLALALALAGCADAPPEPFDGRPILAPPSTVGDADAGLLVTPFEGLPPDQASALQTELIKALRRRDVVAAAVNPSPVSSLVRGGTLPGPDGQPTIEAELVAPSGLIAREVRLPAVGLDRQDGRADLAARLATALIGNDAAPAPAAPAERRWRVRVAPVAGAPGDGETSLTRAMARALARSGIQVTTDAGGDVLVLQGSVQLGPAASGAQPIAIRWSVDAPDGRDLGTVSQDNTIPAGSLDKAWGQVADLAARAAAGGVLDLIAKVPPPTAAPEPPAPPVAPP